MIKSSADQPGLYIHVPFCRGKCDYCDFYSLPVGEIEKSFPNVVNDYLPLIQKELDVLIDKWNIRTFDTLYFGGGTSSLLPPEMYNIFISSLVEKGHLNYNAEITLELNPEDCTANKLAQYKQAGINRMILGVQTLSKRNHSFIGRSTACCTTETLDIFFSDAAIEHGVDIICGIPGQSNTDLLADLNLLLQYAPEHISVYLLTIEDGTNLAKRVAVDETFDTLQHDIFLKIRSHLIEKGYEHYEISNYAKPGKRSYHNMKYWTWKPFLGVGAGAYSFISNNRFHNSATAMEYLQGNINKYETELFSEDQVIVEYLLTSIRFLDGFSLDDMRVSCGLDLLPDILLNAIDLCIKEDLLHFCGDAGLKRVALTEKGILFSNEVTFRLTEPFL